MHYWDSQSFHIIQIIVNVFFLYFFLSDLCIPKSCLKFLLLLYILHRINYALFEELEAQDMNRTRDIYKYDLYKLIIFSNTMVLVLLRLSLWQKIPTLVIWSRECLKLIPHKKFSFAKIWILAAQYEIRQKDLKGARRILGNAIGMAPKDKVSFSLNLIWTQ